MSRRIAKACAEIGCPTLVYDGRYCPAHQRAAAKAQDDRRGSATERGYDGKWRKARDVYIAAHPMCVACDDEGRVVSATTVDHVIPHRLKEARDSGDLARIAKAEKLFWSRSNWQSLCTPCHTIVKQREEAQALRSSRT